MRIQLRSESASLDPFLCGGVLDAPQLAARVRRRRFTIREDDRVGIKFF